MARIFSQKLKGKLYEVRTAGATRRLYTNGVLHSQYNPNRKVTGSVWDLLVIPALIAREELKNILVLGVGGGAALHLLSDIAPKAHITGIELDHMHLTLARKYFGLGDLTNLNLVCDDAIDWVQRYRGEGFDLVVEDLFADENSDAERAFPFDRAWLSDLTRLTTQPGSLVINFGSLGEFRRSPLSMLPPYFESGFSARHQTLENVVACCSTRRLRLLDVETASRAYLGARVFDRINLRNISKPRRFK